MTGPAMLTPAQLAERWSVQVGSLANMRSQGRGPAYLRLGASVRYLVNDVSAYESANRKVTS